MKTITLECVARFLLVLITLFNMENEDVMIGDSYWDDLLYKWKYTKLTCRRCNALFTEFTNIGRWKCSQHADYEGPPPPGERWKCCNAISSMSRSYINRACVRADHSAQMMPFDEAWDVKVPLSILKLMGIPLNSPCIVKTASDNNTNRNVYANNDSETITIRRYDVNHAISYQDSE